MDPSAGLKLDDVSPTGIAKAVLATHVQASAAAAATKAVAAAAQKWTKLDEARYQRRRIFRVLSNRRRGRIARVAKNDRAARRLGYVSNKAIMALPYNTVSESSQDARSLLQRSSTETDVKEDKERDSKLREELEILPAVFWSMGKSFHSGKSDAYFIQKENEWMEDFQRNVLGQEGLTMPSSPMGLSFFAPRRIPMSKREFRHSTANGLIAWSLPLPFILGTQSGRWTMDRFLALAYFLGCPIIDRTGLLNDQVGLKLVNLHPIPKRLPVFDKSLDSIMMDRAREALICCVEERRNREIHILWSGGIDTTAVVCAFLRITDNDLSSRSLIVIRYTERSIEEYPAFFHDFIAPQLRHSIILGHVRDVFTIPDEGDDMDTADIPLVVTGDPADMLFGTFRMADALIDGAYSLNEPWEKRAPILLHERCLLLNATDYFDPKTKKRKNPPSSKVQRASKAWVEWIRPQVLKSPVPIRTMFDWWWWITYSCKYNHDVHRVFYNREEVSSKLRDRVYNFYQSEDFHQYSFAAHEQKMKDKRVWGSYKYPLKEFILSYCRSNDRRVEVDTMRTSGKDVSQDLNDHDVYFYSKIKVPSVANSFGMEVGLDSNWDVVKFGAASISLKALKVEHGDSLHDAFLTIGGKQKRRGDIDWVQGNFGAAQTSYSHAQLQHMNCTEDIQSCKNAEKRSSKGKEPKFRHDQATLDRRKARGVVAHRTWDNDDTVYVGGAWAFFGDGGGGE